MLARFGFGLEVPWWEPPWFLTERRYVVEGLVVLRCVWHTG